MWRSTCRGRFQAILLLSFHVFINDISNFAVEGCVLNMYADDVIIYTSATSKEELECSCKSVLITYLIGIVWTSYVLIKRNLMSWLFGSKWQLKSLNLDDFTIAVDSNNLFLAKPARYLGLWVRNGLSWDDHILELCRKMYYHFHTFRRLSKILPSALLLNIYKAYVQSKIDYGLSIWGCAKGIDLNHVPRIQNLICLQESCVIILIIFTRVVLI